MSDETTTTTATDFTDYSIDPTAAEMLKIAEDCEHRDGLLAFARR